MLEVGAGTGDASRPSAPRTYLSWSPRTRLLCLVY